MKKLSVIVLALFVLSLVPSTGWAASPWTTGATYKEKMTGKLKFGVKNTLLGWTELFQEPSEAWKQEGNRYENTLVGLGTGLVFGVVDTIGGVLHLATFPVTQVDVPLPENGVECKCLDQKTA